MARTPKHPNTIRINMGLKPLKEWGGKRKGAGRPNKEPTVTMRIPISKVEAVKALIKK